MSSHKRSSRATAGCEQLGFNAALAAVREQIYQNKFLRQTLLSAAKRGAKFLPSSGNLGDGLIQLGNFDYFDYIEWMPDVISISSPTDLASSHVLVLGGGGGWKEGLLEEQARSLRPFLESGGELILLPSSIDGFGEFFARFAKQVTLFVREGTSAANLRTLPELSGRVHLCPDMAFAVKHHWLAPFVERAGTGTLHIHRTDGESLSSEFPRANIDLPILWNGIEWSTRQNCLDPLLGVAHLISQFANVDTDRLHMAVLSAMLNRTVVMRPNSYFKNRAVYEYSLSALSGLTFSAEQMDAAGEFPESTDTRGEAADPATQKPANDGVNGELVALARLRREYFEPELARLRQVISEYERTKHEWFEPELLRIRTENDALRAELGESDRARQTLEGERASRYEPELARLQNEINERDRIQAEWFEPELRRLRAEADEWQAKTSVAHESIRALENKTIQQDQALEHLIVKNQQLTQAGEETTRFLQAKLSAMESELTSKRDELIEQVRLRSEEDQPELQRLRLHIRRLQDEIGSLALEKAMMAKRFESETKLLRLNVRHRKRNIWTQVLRRRITSYAEMHDRMISDIARLEARLREIEQLREHWYVPELTRLTHVIDQQDKVRLEWFEPRLSYFETRVNELEKALRESDEVREKWFEPQLAQRAERIAELEAMVNTTPRWRRFLRRMKRIRA